MFITLLRIILSAEESQMENLFTRIQIKINFFVHNCMVRNFQMNWKLKHLKNKKLLM